MDEFVVSENERCRHCKKQNSLEYDIEFGGGDLFCNSCGLYTTPVNNQLQNTFDSSEEKMIQISNCDPSTLYREIAEMLISQKIVSKDALKNFKLSALGDTQSTVTENYKINAIFKGSQNRVKAIILFYISLYFQENKIPFDMKSACTILKIEYQMVGRIIKKSGVSFNLDFESPFTPENLVPQTITLDLVSEKINSLYQEYPDRFFNIPLDKLAKHIHTFYSEVDFQETKQNILCYSFHIVLQVQYKIMISKADLTRIIKLSNPPTLSKIIRQQLNRDNKTLS